MPVRCLLAVFLSAAAALTGGLLVAGAGVAADQNDDSYVVRALGDSVRGSGPGAPAARGAGGYVFCGSVFATLSPGDVRGAFRTRAAGVGCPFARRLARAVVSDPGEGGTYLTFRCEPTGGNKGVLCRKGAARVRWSQNAADQASACAGFGAYGYVFARVGISCPAAKRAATAALSVIGPKTDCETPRLRRSGGWEIYGPVIDGLTYQYRSGVREFFTDRPTEC